MNLTWKAALAALGLAGATMVSGTAYTLPSRDVYLPTSPNSSAGLAASVQEKKKPEVSSRAIGTSPSCIPSVVCTPRGCCEVFRYLHCEEWYGCICIEHPYNCTGPIKGGL
jgi:hypothetical protein